MNGDGSHLSPKLTRDACRREVPVQAGRSCGSNNAYKKTGIGEYVMTENTAQNRLSAAPTARENGIVGRMLAAPMGCVLPALFRDIPVCHRLCRQPGGPQVN